MSRGRKIALIVVCAVSALGYLVYLVYQSRRPLEWSGMIEAHTMDIGSRVGGRVKSVEAREGSWVEAGQVLVVLESFDLPAQKLQAEGQLDQAEAALERIVNKAMPTARRAEIAAAEARLRAERANMERLRIEHERADKLFKQEAVSESERDTADLVYRNATAAVAATSAQRDQLLQGTPQDVKAAQGQVASARGRLDQINALMDELTIRAPLAARVEALDLRPGDILAANATAARLLDPRELFVRIYVPETQLGHVRPGLDVPVYVDSFPKRSFPGTVEFVSDVGEFTPRNLQTVDERADQVFATRVRIDNTTEVLRVGMAAFVRVAR